jgi:peptide/nickel transport system ATP-binding protein/oligopeptide transport system ATP-binding protein
MRPPSGCRFHTRCAYVLPECRVTDPPLLEVAPGHHVACLRRTPGNLEFASLDGGVGAGPQP